MVIKLGPLFEGKKWVWGLILHFNPSFFCFRIHSPNDKPLVERKGTHKESAVQDKQWSGAQAGLTAKAVKLKVLLRRNTKYRESCK